jgi:translation elongation factor EF-Tu-like GTPase
LQAAITLSRPMAIGNGLRFRMIEGGRDIGAGIVVAPPASA